MLKCHTKPFKSHSCVNVFCRKIFQTSVCFSVELHKNQIPDFHNLRMIVVDQFQAGNFCFFLRSSQIDVDFGTRSTRSARSHFPEIIFFVAIDDSVFGDELFPQIVSFGIAFQILLCITFKNGDIKIFFRNSIDLSQQFPSPGNCFFFEIIAKTPVSKHLKHRVVVGITANIVQVIVLSGNP